MSETPADSAVRGVLFDVDGTLIDSGYQHALAWWQAFRQQGLDIPVATIHRAIGMGGDKLIPHVLDASGLHPDDIDAEQADAAQSAIFSCHWPELRLLPGARELVIRCHDAGLRTVLASSAGPAELSVLRRLLDVEDYLDAVTGSADAQQSKPAPELVRIALDKAGLEPDTSVFIGDSVWDAQAATKISVRCIGVECGGTSAAELRAAGALAVYRDPAGLIDNWDNSVLAPAVGTDGR